MKMNIDVFYSSCIILLTITVSTHGAKMVCQYASWAVYRASGGNFKPDMVDPTLCTHGVYVTAGLDSNDQLMSLDPWADLEVGGGMGGYKKFTNLKLINPEFKAILALGGWAYANSHFAAIAANSTRRREMAQSAVLFLKYYGFDGLEVDWLYPSTVNEKANFPLLLAELRLWFEPEGFEILATAAALELIIDQAYDLPAMGQSLDYFLMIGYDYEGAWNPWTGLTTPLYLNNSTLCVNSTVNAYLSRGVNPAQLILGFPGFGRTYTLADPALHGIGDVSLGPGDPGPYTVTAGVLSYNEIAEDTTGWTIERDALSQAPYAYKGNQWMSMDDETSATFKAEYCTSKGLGGAAIWTVDEDRFVGEAFLLVRAILAGFAKH
ncbi:hypothetical protein B566_EDAN000666 [Ephemera danica]|nr:hypothetical protein B566_EDAN000666 [Ephemera danica]